jgi:hypothetical protein
MMIERDSYAFCNQFEAIAMFYLARVLYPLPHEHIDGIDLERGNPILQGEAQG